MSGATEREDIDRLQAESPLTLLNRAVDNLSALGAELSALATVLGIIGQPLNGCRTKVDGAIHDIKDARQKIRDL